MLSISVVIVNYNSERFLQDNIRSLLSQSVAFKQIIIVDNDSKDRSLDVISGFSGISLIVLAKNIGYPAALNIGIRKCDSDLVFVANSDIYLDDDFNRVVTEKFTKEVEIDILSPLILRFGGKIVDSAGQTYSRSLYPVEIGFNKEAFRQKFEEKEVFSVCGAATVFRSKSMEKLKVEDEYYDESFFLFWEDFDICWRANLYGQKIIFLPDAKVFHFRGGTLGKTILTRFSMALARTGEIKFHLVKNRYLTLIKNFRIRKFWYLTPFMIIKDLVWVSMLTLSSPKIIIKMFGSGKIFLAAFRKRKIIKKNE